LKSAVLEFGDPRTSHV